MLVSFGLHSSLSRAKEGWLKLLPKRKFRESKTGDEEKKILGKNPFQNQHDMKQSGPLIFLHSGKMQGRTKKQ